MDSRSLRSFACSMPRARRCPTLSLSAVRFGRRQPSPVPRTLRPPCKSRERLERPVERVRLGFDRRTSLERAALPLFQELLEVRVVLLPPLVLFCEAALREHLLLQIIKGLKDATPTRSAFLQLGLQVRLVAGSDDAQAEVST